jgi:hypothetical protein
MNERTEALVRRLAALERAGLSAWDPPAIPLVERLIAAATRGEPQLADRLCTRAESHLDRLERSLADAKLRADAAVRRVAALEPDLVPVLERTLAAQAFCDVQRLARRCRPVAAPRKRRAREQNAALAARAEARGLPLADPREAPDPEAVVRASYRESVSAARASLAVTRAVAAVPEDAGHYNPLQVAAHALEAMSAYPAYLRAQLARLEALELLGELPKLKARTRGRSGASG